MKWILEDYYKRICPNIGNLADVLRFTQVPPPTSDKSKVVNSSYVHETLIRTRYVPLKGTLSIHALQSYIYSTAIKQQHLRPFSSPSPPHYPSPLRSFHQTQVQRPSSSCPYDPHISHQTSVLPSACSSPRLC